MLARELRWRIAVHFSASVGKDKSARGSVEEGQDRVSEAILSLLMEVMFENIILISRLMVLRGWNEGDGHR